MLGATINPDFSQVEADAGQVAVNERFALFFPEKRPFFLEGTEVFATPQRLVYTRAMVDPVGGAKLTGQAGGPAGLFGELSLSHSRIVRANGELFSVAQIPRARLQYQLSKALCVRGIVEYNLQDRDALRDAEGVPLVLTQVTEGLFVKMSYLFRL